MVRLLLLAVLLIVAPRAGADELRIFAAASLKGPLDEVFPEAVISYAGSGAVARQVLVGAPADLVVLANAAWMEPLVTAGVVEAEEVRDILSNRLVLVGPPGAPPLELTPEALAARLGDGRLAIGLTSAVPAGIHGREALVALGLWEGAAPRLAEVENVRLALVLVARGEVPLAVVYASDLAAAPDLAPVADLPPESHAPIRYTAAPVAGGSGAAAMERLLGSEAQAIFAAAGFLPPAPPEGAE